MKAIILEKPGHFSFRETGPPGELTEGHARVRNHRIGICGTDLHAFQGKQTFFSYPRILGHELGVEITEVEDNDMGFSVGDLCTVEPFLNCGMCFVCRGGKPNCCTHIQVLGVHRDGGMQDYMSVPIKKLHKSASLSLEQLALVEPLAIGSHSVQRAQLEPEENVLIIGVGPIGLTVMLSAQIAGARITVMDISETRLAFCREVMKVDRYIDTRFNIVRQLEDLHDGELPTTVLDCTGNPKSMEASFNYVAHGGRLMFVGHYPGDITFNDANFHMRELELIANRNATPEDFKRVIGYLETGQIDPIPLVTDRVPRDQVIKSFPGWLDPDAGVVKAMVEWT